MRHHPRPDDRDPGHLTREWAGRSRRPPTALPTRIRQHCQARGGSLSRPMWAWPGVSRCDVGAVAAGRGEAGARRPCEPARGRGRPRAVRRLRVRPTALRGGAWPAGGQLPFADADGAGDVGNRASVSICIINSQRWSAAPVGEVLETIQIISDPGRLAAVMARVGKAPSFSDDPAQPSSSDVR